MLINTISTLNDIKTRVELKTKGTSSRDLKSEINKERIVRKKLANYKESFMNYGLIIETT